MSPFLHIQDLESLSVAEFTTDALMDRRDMEIIWAELTEAIESRGRRRWILDFHQVAYISSSAVGILLAMRNKLEALDDSSLVLFGVGPKLMELLKLVRLLTLFQIVDSREQAIVSASAPKA